MVCVGHVVAWCVFDAVVGFGDAVDVNCIKRQEWCSVVLHCGVRSGKEEVVSGHG